MDHEPIIDIDQHLCDLTPQAWAGLGARYADRAPREVVVNGVRRLAIEDRLFPKVEGPGRGSPKGSAAGGSATLERRLSAMDHAGIGAGLLLMGNLGMAVHAVRERSLRAALCESYRGWQRSQAHRAPGRFYVGLLCDPASLPTPQDLSDPCVAGLAARPTNSDGSRWFHPSHEPLLRLASETGLPLVLHAGTGYYQQSPAADLYDNYFYTHLHSHVLEMEMAMSELVAGGCFARYPGLRVAFVEAGIAWVAPFAERLELHLRSLGAHVVGDRRHVHEILERHCLFTALGSDAGAIAELSRTQPWLRVALGSDFPHWDALDLQALVADLAPAARRAIRHDNARGFFSRIGEVKRAA